MGKKLYKNRLHKKKLYKEKLYKKDYITQKENYTGKKL